MLELYGMSSPNVMKVAIMLEEVQLSYRMRQINIWGQEQFTPQFKALNPNNKVPVLVDPDGPGGKPITVFESGAILLYLAEKTGRFLPADPHQRWAAMQWLMVQMGSIGPMFGQANHFRRSAPPGDGYALARYVSEIHRLYGVLDVRLSEADYLGGEYSVADMAAYPWVALYHGFNGVDMSAHPAVQRWIDAIAARPAVAAVHGLWDEVSRTALDKRKNADEDGFDRLFGRGKFALGPVV